MYICSPASHALCMQRKCLVPHSKCFCSISSNYVMKMTLNNQTIFLHVLNLQMDVTEIASEAGFYTEKERAVS